MAELTEQEQIRRNSLNELKKLGINPYPAALYEVNAKSSEILEKYPHDNTLFQNISIAGRIMSRRIMGAASFVELQDSYGRIQLYVKRDEICPDEDKTMYNTVFKRLLDIGDIIGVTGYVFVTQMGEISIHVKTLTVLSKSLRPLPIVKEKDGVVYDAFSDPEQRYRMRYVDLIVNPHVRETFIQRAKIVNTMREYFNEQGYLEVDTPVLQSIPGGAAARPFITHHNALDIDLYLRIANELYLKRLIVGGYAGVYEFSRCASEINRLAFRLPHCLGRIRGLRPRPPPAPKLADYRLPPVIVLLLWMLLTLSVVGESCNGFPCASATASSLLVVVFLLYHISVSSKVDFHQSGTEKGTRERVRSKVTKFGYHYKFLSSF